MIRREHDQSQLAAREVLLIPDVLVARQQQIEPLSLGRVEQGAVLQPLPAQFIRSHHFMTTTGNGPAEPGCWRRKEPSRNRRGLLKRILGKSKNLVHLFSTDRREPFQELGYRGTLVEVLEQSGNPQARTTEAPRPAKLAGVSVDGATAAPVHTPSLSSIGIKQSPHFPN